MGEWSRLGTDGYSKLTFTHPAMEDMIIKIPARHTTGYRSKTPEGDLIKDFQNRKTLQRIAAQYDQIFIPPQALYPTSNGIIIVEQKIEAVYFDDIKDSAGVESALAQLNVFSRKTGLCDVSPQLEHNARFLSLGNSSMPTIAIYDTDCVITQTFFKWPGDPKNPLKISAGYQKERNQRSALFLVGATGIAAGATAIAKKIDKIAPARLLRAAITCGVVSACAAYFDEPLFQPSATILGASLGIVVGAIGAVPFLAREKIKSCAKNCLARALPTWHFT